jgi:hypothetical protein
MYIYICIGVGLNIGFDNRVDDNDDFGYSKCERKGINIKLIYICVYIYMYVYKYIYIIYIYTWSIHAYLYIYTSIYLYLYINVLNVVGYSKFDRKGQLDTYHLFFDDGDDVYYIDLQHVGYNIIITTIIITIISIIIIIILSKGVKVNRIDKNSHKNQYNPPADAATVAQQRVALQYYESLREKDKLRGIYMYIYVYIYIHIYAYKYTYVYICTCMYTYNIFIYVFIGISQNGGPGHVPLGQKSSGPGFLPHPTGPPQTSTYQNGPPNPGYSHQGPGHSAWSNASRYVHMYMYIFSYVYIFFYIHRKDLCITCGYIHIHIYIYTYIFKLI